MNATKPRLTPNQKSRVWMLGRRSTISPLPRERPGRWILAADCGGPAALEHLYRKGYAERRIEIGSRGGEHCLYRLTDLGWEEYDRQRGEKYVSGGSSTLPTRMLTGEIDGLLIRARDQHLVARVKLADGTEVRGLPGHVFRGLKSGRLLLPMGLRMLDLAKVVEVVVEERS